MTITTVLPLRDCTLSSLEYSPLVNLRHLDFENLVVAPLINATTHMGMYPKELFNENKYIVHKPADKNGRNTNKGKHSISHRPHACKKIDVKMKKSKCIIIIREECGKSVN